MSDHVTSDKLFERLTVLEAGHSAMNTALGLIVDTLQVQTNLLQELCALAQDEPEPSSLGRILSELTFSVGKMGANVETVATKLDELPERIGAEIDRFLCDPPPSPTEAG